MIGRTLLSAALALALLAVVAATALADSGPSATTFSDVVGSSRLIVLADVTQRPDGGFDLKVERVLKGHAAATLRFAATPSPAVQPGWRRAVVAFTDPTTIDSRAVTIAWHVAASGALDPERYQQYPGTPQTLAALLAWFGRLPATDSLPATGAPTGADWRPAILVLAGLAGLAGALRLSRPSRHDSQ
jgi:hypothetical protein